MTRRISRRALLRGLAASGGSLALPALVSQDVEAAPTVMPKRIVFLYVDDGLLHDEWLPTGDGTDFVLSPVLAPLEPYQSQMFCFENLDMRSHHLDPTAAANAHYAGSTHAMTGAFRSTGALPGGESIDQLIASQLATGGPVTLRQSINVLCSAFDAGYLISNAFTNAPGSVVPFIHEPSELYDYLFPTPLDPANVKAAKASELIFGLSRSETQALAQRLSATDATKVQQHANEITSFEQRLALTSGRESYRPDPSIVAAAKDYSWPKITDVQAAPEYAAAWNVNVETNLKLIAAALHTDTTRVASAVISNPPEAVIGFDPKTQFGGQFEGHHGLTHAVNNPQVAIASDPVARQLIRNGDAAKIAKIKFFLDELASLKEPDGTSLLEHTLVVVTSQIAHGNHGVDRLPWMVFGSAHGFLQPGRFLRFQRTKLPLSASPNYQSGRPHNDLFVTLANAMDVPITTFGAPSACTGPIAEMMA